jgi:hypothetical protein
MLSLVIGLTAVISRSSENGGLVMTILMFLICITVAPCISSSTNDSSSNLPRLTRFAARFSSSDRVILVSSLSSLTEPGCPLLTNGSMSGFRCTELVSSLKNSSIFLDLRSGGSMYLTEIPFISAISF